MSEEDALRKAGSIGRPMMFTEAKLVAADEVTTEAEAMEGQLCLRGPHVSKGYWQDPAATAAVLDPNGWFHTGDIARCDPDGFYYIVGRSKDMFISGGVNVYPAEIEAELLRHPAIADAAVIGVAHPTWGEVGAAFVVLKSVPPPPSPPGIPAAQVVASSSQPPSSQPTSPAEDLTAFLAAKLAKYKLPKEFIFIESLPRTAYGKVVKADLRDQYSRIKAS